MFTTIGVPVELVKSELGKKCPFSQEMSLCLSTVISHFIALWFIVLHINNLFTNWRTSAGLWSKPYWHPFSNSICSFVSLCPILVTTTIFQTSKLLLYFLWWSSISDFWCYCCKKDCKKINTHWRLSWWLAFLSVKYFLIKVCTFFYNTFRTHFYAHLVLTTVCSISITFICTRKPKFSCDSLYCSLHFIAVVRTRAHSICYACIEEWVRVYQVDKQRQIFQREVAV